MKTIAEQLKHDFKKGSLYLYDSNGNNIYFEASDGYCSKREYNSNGNLIYFENSYEFWYKYEYDSNGDEIYYEGSDGYWYKYEYDTNGKIIYYENSNGIITDNRPKSSCEGKLVEIEGKTYKLVELTKNK